MTRGIIANDSVYTNITCHDISQGYITYSACSVMYPTTDACKDFTQGTALGYRKHNTSLRLQKSDGSSEGWAFLALLGP